MFLYSCIYFSPKSIINRLQNRHWIRLNLIRNCIIYQSVVISAPSIDGFGGIPAGLQSDKDSNLWIADMRLGLIKLSPDGMLTQVGKI